MVCILVWGGREVGNRWGTAHTAQRSRSTATSAGRVERLAVRISSSRGKDREIFSLTCKILSILKLFHLCCLDYCADGGAVMD